MTKISFCTLFSRKIFAEICSKKHIHEPKNLTGTPTAFMAFTHKVSFIITRIHHKIFFFRLAFGCFWPKMAAIFLCTNFSSVAGFELFAEFSPG
jgi:hypothetical protein